jgi:hypothetical protein
MATGKNVNPKPTFSKSVASLLVLSQNLLLPLSVVLLSPNLLQNLPQNLL